MSLPERLVITPTEAEQLARSYNIEEAASRLLVAVHKAIVDGRIADRTAIDDAHLVLRDALNPHWPNEANWWPET